MNTRAFTLALIIALFSMFLVHTYVEDRETSMIKKYGQQNSVVIAKEDIKEFELLDDSKVTVVAIPKKFLAPGHFKTIRELENTIATVPILKGEQITKPRVTYPGDQTGLSREVSVGKRAFALALSDSEAVSKLIKPGDRVDLLVGLDYSGGRKEMQKIQTVFQDVRILSTGLDVSNNLPIIGVKTSDEVKKMKLNTYSNFRTITLELDPYQVQKLHFLVQFSGLRVHLSLRNVNDKEIVRIQGTRLFDVLGEEAGEAKAYFSEKNSKAGR